MPQRSTGYSGEARDQPRKVLEAAEGLDGCPSYAAEQLFEGQREVHITHQGTRYRLRLTRSGGLILNK
jgi:hemin uptake protein HemP